MYTLKMTYVTKCIYAWMFYLILLYKKYCFKLIKVQILYTLRKVSRNFHVQHVTSPKQKGRFMKENNMLLQVDTGSVGNVIIETFLISVHIAKHFCLPITANKTFPFNSVDTAYQRNLQQNCATSKDHCRFKWECPTLT